MVVVENFFLFSAMYHRFPLGQGCLKEMTIFRRFSSFSSALRSIRPGVRPSVAYDTLVSSGVLRRDDYQREVLPFLDSLHSHVSSISRGRSPKGLSENRGFNGGSAGAIEGLYMWGGTGCGKTMLMDMFLACVPTEARARRVHFHAFMQDVNARLHRMRQSGVRSDPLAAVAKELVGEAWCLCFDEVQVTDVGDALILRRLFEGLYAGGLVMLSTSNRPSKQLYAGGLNRELFVPFVHLLQARCAERHLSSPTDYRLQADENSASYEGAEKNLVWIHPELGKRSIRDVERQFEEAWARAVAGEAVGPTSLVVEGQGRNLEVRQASLASHVVRFTFSELCSAYVGAGDYAAIAKTFKWVFIEGVPVLGLSERNELRRMVTLVDILYDNKVRLTVSAAAPSFQTFDIQKNEKCESGGGVVDGASFDAAKASGGRLSLTTEEFKSKYDEVFAWDRTVSRLLVTCSGIRVFPVLFAEQLTSPTPISLAPTLHYPTELKCLPQITLRVARLTMARKLLRFGSDGNRPAYAYIFTYFASLCQAKT